MTTHLLMLAAAMAAPPATAPAPNGPGEGWALVWGDEFDVPGAPDPEKWDYEEGFVRNREEQWYTRDRRENARVEGGHLVLEARREPWPNPNFVEGDESWQRNRREAAYTSASINTRDKHEFLYGRLEVRAKVPAGRGMWPAFWTLGVNRSDVGWPRCGEIDVMEWLGHSPDKVHGTIHYFDPERQRHAHVGGKLQVAPPTDGFHVYAAEWDEERIRFYFDGEEYFAVDLSRADPIGEDGEPVPSENPFRKPHYLLLNLAVGGGWGGEVDPEGFPKRYVVDYVRVYQREPAAAGPAAGEPAP